MTTQVRCPQCRHLFADSEIRHTRSRGAKALVGLLPGATRPTTIRLLLGLGLVALVVL